ncbi:uncharacterized protein LOC141668925 [Apium graveolens]|uniref:uncharacterized protein LOC141668925 n=1 Tax=Apium graveolens TaxID=4045 RepID=UPI003D79BD42
MMGNGQNRYLFTESQLEEFKHQALIYSYIVSGAPVPTDLLSDRKRKLDFSSTLFLHKQGRWGCYHNSFNGKEDLEPGRCKRTDGKKWRCSREAHRESKYCERHMHRGRNSSRKPVTNATNTTSPLIKIRSNSVHDQPSKQTSTLIHPASLYSQPSSRHHNTSTQQQFLECRSFYQTNKDYRFMPGKRALFPMDSKTVRSQHEPYQTSKVASSETINDHDQRTQEECRDLKQHCFILGNDFRPARSINVDRREDNQEGLHHFSSEWPLKSKSHWLHNRENQSDHASTSTPLSTLQLFQSKPIDHW